MSDQVGPAGLTDEDIARLRRKHEPSLTYFVTHHDTGFCPACEEPPPCPTIRLLNALAAQAARADAAEVERDRFRRALSVSREEWGDLAGRADRERARADAAEATLAGLGACYDDLVTDGRALVEENNDLEADRDRERQRAEELAAALSKAIKLCWHCGGTGEIKDADFRFEPPDPCPWCSEARAVLSGDGGEHVG